MEIGDWKRDLTDHEGVLSIALRSASGAFEVDESQRDFNLQERSLRTH